jgi:predicted dehydrogenase
MHTPGPHDAEAAAAGQTSGATARHASTAAAGHADTAAQPVRVALVGCGAIAVEYAVALAALPAAVLVAVADPDPAACAHIGGLYQQAAHGAPAAPAAFPAQSAMLAAARPDLVIITAPPGTHAPLSIAALEAGAHVWCEKPIARSLAELDAIEAAAARAGRTCTAVFQWRFGAAGAHIAAHMAAGTFGLPLLGVCHTLWYRPQAYYDVPWRADWVSAGGGVSMTLGIHALDFTLWLLGGRWHEAHAVQATHDRRARVENLMLAHVKMGGAWVSVVNSALSPRQVSTVRLDCTRATVHLEHLYQYDHTHWSITPVPGIEADPAWGALPAGPGSIAAQCAHVVGTLSTGGVPTPSAAAVRPTLTLLAALYKSAFTGKPVVEGEITPDDPFYHAMNGTVNGRPYL